MKLKEAVGLMSLDGVDLETLTKKEVMKAFREKSRFMHPDKHKGEFIPQGHRAVGSSGAESRVVVDRARQRRHNGGQGWGGGACGGHRSVLKAVG